MTAAPGYWMNETSGLLRPAVEAYLYGRPMTTAHVMAWRAYLRQWMAGPWQGDDADSLRADIDRIADHATLAAWLDRAAVAGIDPL